MNSCESITLAGSAVGTEAATVILCPVRYHADGIDVSVAIRVIEYEFKIETFFYGYNFHAFLTESEAVISGNSNRAHLLNYNETFVIEFITENKRTFLSAIYESILPEVAEQECLKVLKDLSRVDLPRKSGSKFSVGFMPLQDNISVLADWMTDVLDRHTISKVNPYP